MYLQLCETHPKQGSYKGKLLPCRTMSYRDHVWRKFFHLSNVDRQHNYSVISFIICGIILCHNGNTQTKKLFTELKNETIRSYNRLNFIPLWEWTWCHRVFYVKQDWKVRAVVRSCDYKKVKLKRLRPCKDAFWHHIHSQSGIKFSLHLCDGKMVWDTVPLFNFIGRSTVVFFFLIPMKCIIEKNVGLMLIYSVYFGIGSNINVLTCCCMHN